MFKKFRMFKFSDAKNFGRYHLFESNKKLCSPNEPNELLYSCIQSFLSAIQNNLGPYMVAPEFNHKVDQ